MSSLQTRSVFYYGHLITILNRKFDWLEGVVQKTATMDIGDKTLTQFCEELAAIMTDAGTQTYTVTVNRTTGIITIAAASSFTIQFSGGPNNGQSGWPLAGYTSNKTGTSNVGDVRSGSQYICQYKLFNYVAIEDYQVLEQSAVNQSAQGQVQVISFGEGRRMECNIKLITNENLENQAGFYYNATGVADARTFLNYLINKHRVEFMPNEGSRATYEEVLLESTPEDRDGTAFKLKNMAIDVYQTGKLLFREVIR